MKSPKVNQKLLNRQIQSLSIDHPQDIKAKKSTTSKKDLKETRNKSILNESVNSLLDSIQNAQALGIQKTIQDQDSQFFYKTNESQQKLLSLEYLTSGPEALPSLHKDIQVEVAKAKTRNKKFGWYINNYKSFKEGVLQPPDERELYQLKVNQLTQKGDQIMQQAEKQNKDIFDEIQVLRQTSQKGFIPGGNARAEKAMKSRVMHEMNTHVRRQFQIDQIMRTRLDDKANKLLFGVSVTGGTMRNIINTASSGERNDQILLDESAGNQFGKNYHGQQQVSHVIFKDKYSHHKDEYMSDSGDEDDEPIDNNSNDPYAYSRTN